MVRNKHLLSLNTAEIGWQVDIEKNPYRLDSKQGNRRNNFCQTINIQLRCLKQCCVDSSAMSAKCYCAKKQTKTSTHGITRPQNIPENTDDIMLSFPLKIINKASMSSSCACISITNRKMTIFISSFDTQYFHIVQRRITEGNVPELL